MIYALKIRPLVAFALASCLTPLLNAQRTPEISSTTRMEIVRAVSAEFAFTRKQLPLGNRVITIKTDGSLEQSDREIYELAMKYGQVARAGDRVQLTALEFKDKEIVVEINGGPKKRKKWYQRIEIGSNGGSSPVDPRPEADARGLSIVVKYDKHVPEMTAQQLRDRLEPLFDFTVKSAAQAYTETLPKNVQDAIKDHRVLVGMTKEMVTYSKGRPPQRVREKDENQNDYEEWIFGAPPDDVEFVRFVGDEVVQLKIMRVDGEKIVRTEKEVILPKPGEDIQTAQAQRQDSQPTGQTPGTSGKAPTLRRPGDPAPQLEGAYGSPNSAPPSKTAPPTSPKPSEPPKGERLPD